MNQDTPGAVPSDDFPFLGPAVSPRRQDAGSPLQDSGELAGPFLGGVHDRASEEVAPLEAESAIGSSLDEPGIAGPQPEPTSEPAWTGYEAGAPAEDEAVESSEPAWTGYESGPPGEAEALESPAEAWTGYEASAPAEEEALESSSEGWTGFEAGPPTEDEVLESLPGADWPADDFPWLSPSQPEPEPEEETAEPWRPTADMDELTAEPQPYVIDPEAAVQHLSWIGEPVSEGEAEPVETEAYTGAPEEAAEEALDIGAFAPDAVEDERAGFAVDSESAEESWTRGEGWREAARGEDEVAAAEGPAFGDEEELAPATGEGLPAEDRWEEKAGFRVEDEPQEETVAERWTPDREAVEATPLPVGEWESPAASTEAVGEEKGLEEEFVAAGAEADAGAAPGDPLGEVADRLERIARSLRSGQPLQAVEQGDPLQLLITGYALGFSEARRGGR